MMELLWEVVVLGKKYREVVEQCESIGSIVLVGQREFDRLLLQKNCLGKDVGFLNFSGITPSVAIVARPATRHIDIATYFITQNVETLIEDAFIKLFFWHGNTQKPVAVFETKKETSSVCHEKATHSSHPDCQSENCGNRLAL